MIASAVDFADYFDGVRRRTVGFFRMIPADRADWAPEAGEYTCGDIVRHVAACERMLVGAVVDGRSRYPGHERALAPTLGAALAELDAGHAACDARLRALDAGALATSRPALEPDARPVRAWRLLLAMAPDIFGLGVEDVERLTADEAGRSA